MRWKVSGLEPPPHILYYKDDKCGSYLELRMVLRRHPMRQEIVLTVL
jgi:hypothetical protein